MTHFVPLSSHSGVGKWYARPFYHFTKHQYRCTDYNNRSCSRTSVLNNVNSDGGWWVWWCSAENTIISVSSLTGVCDAKVHIKKNDLANREWARQREYHSVTLLYSTQTDLHRNHAANSWTYASMKNTRVVQWGKLQPYWKSVAYNIMYYKYSI